MDLLQTAAIQCPCCGETIEVLIDCSAGDQSYTEDCRVCCEPLVLTVMIPDSGTARVSAEPENP